MNRLKNHRGYLCGPMENAADTGRDWRERIKETLRGLQIHWFDPLDKPTVSGVEDEEIRQKWLEMRALGQFIELVKEIRKLRCIDLRMVDVCDFLVVYLNNDINTTGTWEELFLANRQKKPILVVIEQGSHKLPMWLFGTLPLEHIFDSWEELHNYLRDVDCGHMDHKRWQFFRL